MSDATHELDRLVGQLQGVVDRKGTAQSLLQGDAIDAVLNSPARTTSVASLRDAPEVAAFRNELVDGLIRADTANQLLRLVAMIVEKML